MNLEKVKTELMHHIGDNATIRAYLGRNKYEEYQVTIKEAYDRIFLVTIHSEKEDIKSFTYSDIITRTIRIRY